MRKFKIAVVLSLIIVLTMGLIACGSNSSKEANSEATNSKANKEIVFWTGLTGPDGDLVQKNIDQYNATNPDYKVKLIRMDGNTMSSKLASVTRAGKGVPDLALIASEQVSIYQSQGMLEPWDKYIKGTKINADNYVKAAWDVGTVNGNQYGIPATIDSWIMYYNKDLADKYAPGALDDNIITYDEIEKAGAAAKKDGIYALGFSWSMQNFANLYLQKGGKYSIDGKPSINNDIAAATIDEFKKLYDQGYMNKRGEDTTKLFENGKIIFLPEGTWMLSEMQKIKSFKWGETFTPQWDANHIVQESGSPQFVMFKSNERSEDMIKSIVKFLEWLQSNQLEWVKAGGNPASLAMLKNKEYANMPQSFLLKTGQKAITILTDPAASFANTEIDNSMWDMLEGKVDVKAQLAKIQQTVTDKMSQ